MVELRGSALRSTLRLAAGLNFLLFGYDQGVLGGVLSTTQFLGAYGLEATDTIIGTTSAIYSIGALVGSLIAAVWGLRVGRRVMLISACCIVIVG